MYAASTPASIGAHVERSFQSKPVAREPRRTSLPSRSQMRRPVLPVAPRTKVVMDGLNRQFRRRSIVELRDSMRHRLRLMDAVAGLLDGPRARGAFLLRS